jgi:glutathionyl-hydroquinone reductase
MSTAMTLPSPPRSIVNLAREGWYWYWQAMMSQLAPTDNAGDYQRGKSEFRETIVTPESNRYRLIIGWACPWAHRCLLVRAFKGLEGSISVSLVVPSRDGVWTFVEPLDGCQTLPELYDLASPNYSLRSTVPVLWDGKNRQIINNESADICRILNRSFDTLAVGGRFDLEPADLREEIDGWNELIYKDVNNGVYRCGFARSQAAYDRAIEALFATLDTLETHLSNNAYLCGDRSTIADIRLFPTLFRFDTIYYSLFKCQLRRLTDYPAVSNYARKFYSLPNVAKTGNLPAAIADYYMTLFPLNPSGIVPTIDATELWL